MRLRGFWLIGILLVLTAFPISAKEGEAFKGLVDVGYRSVDLNGNPDKYREDLNLSDSALRLFKLDLEYQPTGASWFDKAFLDAQGVGGEPYTSARFGLAKRGRYDFDLRYRSSEFFHRDAGYFFRDGGDLHDWNARRSFLDLDLTVDLSERVKLRFGADHGEREGNSTSSRDIQQEVVLLDRPVDQTSSSYSAGIDWQVGWGNLTFEQQFHSYENRWDLSTLSSDGEEVGGSFLDDYRQRRTEEADTPISRITFQGQPTDRVQFSLGYTRTDSDLDYDVNGAWGGLDYMSLAYRTTLTNHGRVERKVDAWDADLSVVVHDQVDVTVDYSRRSYDQDSSIDYLEDQINGVDAGQFVVQGDLANELELDTYGVTVDWHPLRTLSFAVGAGRQQRTKNFELSGPKVETERTIYRAGARWRPNRIWSLRLDLETGDDDEPLTPASATSTDRLRFLARVQPTEQLVFSLRFSDDSKENDLSTALGLPTDDTPPADEIKTAKFDVTTWAFDVTWNGEKIDLNAGYTNSEIDSDADIVYVTDFTLVPAFDLTTTRSSTAYTSDQDIFHASARYAISKSWSAGIHGLRTENQGSFPLETTVYGVEARYEHDSGLYLRTAFDTYDYDEDNPFAGDPASPTPDVNDYDADLWTVALGYRF